MLMAYFKVLFQHLPRGAEKAISPGSALNCSPLEYKAEMLTIGL